MSGITGRLRVERAGQHTSLQDTGRPTSRSWGVPRSGVVDRATNAQLNRLVGNLTSAAVLETGGGLVISAGSPTVVASTSHPDPQHLERGDQIQVEPAEGQRWGYLAVRGGFEVPTVIGSRSRDHLGQMGPLPILDGSSLDVGSSSAGDSDQLAPPWSPTLGDVNPVRFHPGPHSNHVPGLGGVIVSNEWAIEHQQAREFIVLRGADLPQSTFTPSWGFPLIEGAVTLAGDGSLHVSLCNDVTCTGNPVVGVIDPDDLGRLAQRLDGARCRFAAPS